MDNNSKKADTCPYCGVLCSNNTWTELSQNISDDDHDISHEVTCKNCGGKWAEKIEPSVNCAINIYKGEMFYFDEFHTENSYFKEFKLLVDKSSKLIDKRRKERRPENDSE